MTRRDDASGPIAIAISAATRSDATAHATALLRQIVPESALELTAAMAAVCPAPVERRPGAGTG